VIFRFFLSMIVGATLFAQSPDAPQAPGPPDLKTFLNLGDDQIQALQILQAQQAQAIQPVAQQLAQQQQKLQQLLEGTTPDPAAVGQLVIAIRTLTQQVQQTLSTFQQQRVNVLVTGQKEKLPTLQFALVLQPAAVQAASLGLISPP
jgi:hypothetical protein